MYLWLPLNQTTNDQVLPYFWGKTPIGGSQSPTSSTRTARSIGFVSLSFNQSTAWKQEGLWLCHRKNSPFRSTSICWVGSWHSLSQCVSSSIAPLRQVMLPRTELAPEDLSRSIPLERMVNKKVPWSVYLDLIIQNRDVMGNSWESHGTPRKVRNWMIFAQFFFGWSWMSPIHFHSDSYTIMLKNRVPRPVKIDYIKMFSQYILQTYINPVNGSNPHFNPF